MEIIHNLGILSIKKNVEEDVGFMLSNRKGSYCCFYATNSSRYHGLFYFDEKAMEMYKFIDSIELIGNNEVSSVKNGFYFAERRKGDVVESFMMPKNSSSLIYELSGEHEIDLILDCKLSTDNREWGRYYDIFEEKGCVVVKFTKKTDAREDKTGNAEEFVLHLAVKGCKGSFQKNDRWIERSYTSDEKRNSRPFKRYVYNAMRLKGNKFVFSMSKNKNNAIEECLDVFSSIDGIKKNEKEYFLQALNNKSIKAVLKNDVIRDEIKIAYLCTFNSLEKLFVWNKNSFGLFAGLPWFFQFWSRDALVSWKALSKIDNEFAKKLLFDYLSRINGDGRLNNLAGMHDSKNLVCADAHGWLFFRCKEMFDKIDEGRHAIHSIKESVHLIRQSKSANSEKVKGYLKNIMPITLKKENEYHKMLYEIECQLEKSISILLKIHTKDNFEVNEKLGTWMDTEAEENERSGIGIEIQALRLNMYKLMFELSQNHKYKVLENILKNKVRQKFWNGKFLADGLGDFTVRPNIFIAAYAYPELLSQNEWEECFEASMKNLWLEWGGLSTIDKSSPLFANESTGEDIRSYHRGDSWFWINNLAALTLNRINKNKFKKQIEKIISASAEEILWKGCIGCHSELSSAKELKSEGCFNQAWSNAMFIELIDEVFR